MTRKLPWATAAVIIVVAAIGAWTIWGQAPAAPPGTASITTGITNFAWAGDIPETSGIENIYIMTTGGYTKTDDLGTITTGRLGVITEDTGSTDIDYLTSFDIVVAVRIAKENVANLTVDNMYVEIEASNAFTITGADNRSTDKQIFLNESPDNLRVNVVWDNGASGYQIQPGGTLSLDTVVLYLWK